MDDIQVEGWARKQQEMMLSILKDDQRQVTLPSLAQLKLATCIMYALSCRSGFFDDLVSSQFRKPAKPP